VEYQAQAEHIANWLILGLHVFDVDNLRGNVARSSTSYEQILLSITKLSQPKVSNDQVTASRLSEDEIFWFEITMHDLFTVHFIQPVENGKNYLLNLVGLEFFLGFDFIMKKTALQ